MSSLRSTLWKVASVGALFLLPVSTWAAESPMEAIRSTLDRAIAVLQDPAYQGSNHRQQRLDKVREIVVPLFDTREIARRTLGIHWRARTEDQRNEFIRLFTELVERTYSGTLDRYTSDVQFFLDRERIENDFAEVDMRIYDPAQQKTFAINYRMHKNSEKWLIYDVVIENISMVRNYRNQFNRILNRSSYEDLVQSIQNKLKELSASSS